MDKATRVLKLYYQLLNGQVIDKVTYSLEYGISERTFDRDIESIRLFLEDIYSKDQVLFDRESSAYYLSSKRRNYIARMEATAISKILLESKLLRKDEMKGLIDTVLSMVSPYDAKVITEYLDKDVRNYLSETQNAVLKFIGDLYTILKSGRDIEIVVESGGEQPVIMNASPLEIVCLSKVFYLIVAENYSMKSIIEINIDKIISFKSLQTMFAFTLKEKYYQNKEG